MSADGRQLVAGVDLGGTNMQMGVVDERGTILGRSRGKTGAEEGAEAVLDRIVAGIEDACAMARVTPADLVAAGIAAPGAMDLRRGVVIEAPNLGWRNFPLRVRMAERLGVPAVVENDVNGAVLGECRYGAARGMADALGVWVGTGVGGGIVLGGHLHHGPLETAGEIGHTIAEPDAPEGARILEAHASRTGMSRVIAERMRSAPDLPIGRLLDETGQIRSSEALADLWRGGSPDADPDALEIVARAAHLLGIAIANVLTMTAIDTVILGGGITEALGDPWVRKVRASFDVSIFPRIPERYRFVVTELRADAGLLGAAAVARDAL